VNQELEQALHSPAQQRKLGIAIVIVVAMITIAQLFYIFEDKADDQTLRLAQTLVALHQAESPKATEVSDWQALPSLFPTLDFAPKRPQRLGDSYHLHAAEWRPKQDRLQLRLLDDKHHPASLFIQPFSDEQRPLHNRAQQRQQWLVSYWDEEGLFYALVAEGH